MPVSKEVLDEIALSQAEYQVIVQRLGREPTEVELGMFGAMWSEHCGYKHSKPLLKMLPTKGRYVAIKPWEENAGAVEIADGLVIVFKMESHNHPSAIEPYQGAATGVGGIVRDIFTMGARPIALLNSLRFGPLSDARNRYLFGGVVGGIAGYGNCLGIPDVGGEVYFAPCYSANPLVNALCLGIAERKKLISARAAGEGNLVMLVGADTGRDGIHGASGLASRTFEEERELRSAVQVGNPFLEKLLIEACLELAETDWIVGMQDLGAAGLTSASVEMAEKGGSGIEIDLLKVPRREQGMTPYEIMLSESQERMLVVVKKGNEAKVKALFDKWELRSDVIGIVTNDGLTTIKEGDNIVARMPASVVANAPRYQFRVRKPRYLREVQDLNVSGIPDLKPKGCADVLLSLLSSPNIASKKSVYRQYDHQVGDNTVVLPGSDAAVLRIQGTDKAISLTTDGNGRFCYLNPFVGGALAVAEAARNVVCSGARPAAITDCLNFGNPEKKAVYYQLKECIRGMAHACRVLGVPVISGNVSLYNETRGEPIYPTPVVGMLGIIDDVEHHCSSGFKNKDDVVFLLGSSAPKGSSSLAGSEYLAVRHGLVRGNPSVEMRAERQVQKCCLAAIRAGTIASAHDCSEGGLIVTIAESCLLGGIGFVSDGLPVNGRLDEALFGESPSRIVVSAAAKSEKKLAAIAEKYQVPLLRLGTVSGQYFQIRGLFDLQIADLENAWNVELT